MGEYKDNVIRDANGLSLACLWHGYYLRQEVIEEDTGRRIIIDYLQSFVLN